MAGLEIQKHRGAPPPRDARNPVISAQSPEFQLMAIQLGHRPSPANPTLKRFSSFLNILEADCPVNSRRELGDLTIKALHELRAAGIAATPNVILGAVMGMPDMGSRQACSVFFERYVARRRAGGPE